MTGEIGSAGDAATGALIGRAIEPNAGENPHAPTSTLCRSCGTRLTGQFCHACGQNGHLHKTMGAIGHDLLHGVLHLEGKTWRTLPMLAFKPGTLTRRYIAGERARFVSPMAIFLFSVFLMFAVVAQLPGWGFPESDLLKGGGAADVRTRMTDERIKADADLSAARQALARELAKPGSDPSLPARLRDRVRRATEGRDALAQAVTMLPEPASNPNPNRPHSQAPPKNWLDAKWREAKQNPDLLIYKMKTSAYKYSWALIPISLPFIWLLFPLRRDVGMYDHAIFATYSLAFMSLLVILLAVLAATGLPAPAAWTAAVLIPPFHIYKQLKYGYNLSRAGALWRTFLMLNFAIFTLVFFAMLLVWLGLAE